MVEPINKERCVNEQDLLLAAIWSDESTVLANCGFNAQGIQIYRQNLLANAQRALGISFPTVFELLDSDIANSLVFPFLRVSPPEQGDWAQWGEAFADFLATTDIGEAYPYLADCATLDWHVHCALHGRDQTLMQSSLQCLGSGEPSEIYLAFNQNVKLLKTLYPLTDIFQAHHHNDQQQREIAIKAAQHALARESVEQVVMVFRPEFQPQVITLTTSEAVFMQCLLSGKSLAQSLESVAHDENFSFEQWLLNAIERNLIYRFEEK